MKKIITLLSIFTILLLTSCQGDQGIQGDPGQDGVNILGNVFETTVNFTANNNYSNLITIPGNIEVFESDVVLVYLLEDVVPDGQGGSLDVWSQLPQTFFPSQGTLVYNFDHTFVDVRLFLGANFNLNTLGNEFTNDQIFRIAILPADFANADLDMSDLLEIATITE
ncbi:hypothetical protein SCB49_12574 [unidentified eubacterium SCB49]|nr:hypothetical protein SCB49_12574 [unidentified eubacterium SCB49]